ncbi:hypothetical protein ACVMDO_005375 [Bradyrhizobium sp. USDA 4513]
MPLFGLSSTRNRDCCAALLLLRCGACLPLNLSLGASPEWQLPRALVDLSCPQSCGLADILPTPDHAPRAIRDRRFGPRSDGPAQFRMCDSQTAPHTQCRPGESQDPLPRIAIVARRWGHDPVHDQMLWLWVLAFARTTIVCRIRTVIARLAASAKASARQGCMASLKPWRRRDRAIQYAAASRFKHRHL